MVLLHVEYLDKNCHVMPTLSAAAPLIMRSEFIKGSRQ